MMGNLGNQLFIYAFARALQIKYNDELFFDLSTLKRYYYKANYKLRDFNINQDIIYEKKRLTFKQRFKNFLIPSIFHIEQKIQKSLSKDYTTSHTTSIRWAKRGCFFNFDRHYFQYSFINKKDKFVYGYFQSTKYFSEINDIIVDELRVSLPLDSYDDIMMQKIKNANSIAVSVRTIYDKRGDSFIKPDYYFRAIEKMKEIVDNPTFFIFTDSVEKAKEMGFPSEVIFVEQKDACRQLRLMYSCKHFVATNSTFSWWGAFLSTNKNKKIIMPTPWDKQGKLREDIYLDGCIRLDCSFEK